MRKKQGIAFAGLVCTTVLLTACGSKSSSDAKKDTGSAKQEFNLVVQQEMPSADLSLATDTISFTALNNVYEGIYRLDKNNEPQPAGAASKATKSKDGLTYTIKLRKDAKWSNGKPVTAEDYVFAWQRTVDPATASQYAYLYDGIKNAASITAGKVKATELGIKAVNDYELEITLEKPLPYFDYLLAFPSFFPQPKETVEKLGKKYAANSANSVYNGPFTLTEFDGPGSDTKWSYTKNKEYWDAKDVKLKKINVNVVKEASTSLNLFQTNEADDVIVTGELAQQMIDDPSYVSEKQSRTTYLELNQRKADSPYRNADLRKAVSAAIDRKELVKTVLGDGSVASTGLIPKEMSYDPKTKKDFASETKNYLNKKPADAKAYWTKAKKELGITSLNINLLSDDTDASKKVAEYIQNSLEENLTGTKVTITSVPFSVRLDRSTSGDFDIVIGGWGADYADPSSFLDLFKTGNSYNRGQYTNTDYDKAIKAASVTNAGNAEKRWEDMKDAEDILMKDMGVIPIYQKAEGHMRNQKLKGVVLHGAGASYDYKWAYMTK